MTRTGPKEHDRRVEPHVVARSVKALRIVAFSDCHVQDLAAIVAWIERRPEKPDLIIYAGDDVRRFTPDPETNYFEQLAALSHYGVVAVKGNWDSRDPIQGHKVYEVHSRPVAIGRFLIIGIEGSPYMPHTESEIAQHLHRFFPESALNHTIIVVSHAPPRGCLDEAMRGGQGGWVAVRDVVEKDSRVALVVSGHIHNCGGRHDRLGHATVLNAASHNDHGAPAKIAMLLLRPDGAVEDVRWAEVVSSFQLAFDISGIGPAYAARLAQAGITTVEQLADASVFTVGKALVQSPSMAELFIVRAQARLDGRPSLVSAPKLPDKPRLYLDIETDLQQSYTWLVGIASEEGDEVRQFFAPHPDKEGELFQELSAFLTTVADHSVVHFSGSQFDRRVLVQRMESYGLIPPSLLLQSTDCLPTLRRCLALPTRSLGLKEAATCFGYHFAHPDLDGFGVAYEYQRAIQTGSSVPERLLAYNRDDVLALRFLIQEVEKLAAKPPRS